VTVQSEGVPDSDSERAAWLKQSEQALIKTWDNPDDDIFNELLEK